MPTKRLVAIVDDDEAVRTALHGLVRSAGLLAETFASAEAFLVSRHLRRTACLILDINMPGTNGFELHRFLRDSGRKIPTIMITAKWEDRLRAQELRDEIIDCLEKPFDSDELFAALEIVLGRKRHARIKRG